MKRTTLIGVGLVLTIPVLGLAGWLFSAFVDDGEGVGWLVLATALVWIFLVIWWGLRAPPQIPEGERGRYLAFLRHAEYRSPDEPSRTVEKDRS